MLKRKNKIKEIKNKNELFGNESFGIPKDYTKKQKFSGVKLVLYIVVVAILCAFVYVGFNEATYHLLPTVTFDKADNPVLYIKPNSLMLRNKKQVKNEELLKNEAIGTDAKMSDKVFVTNDGERVFFPGKKHENGTFDLYMMVGKAKKMVAENITSYKVQKNGQFVLYLKESSLYISDFKKPEIISSGVTDYYLSKNSQQIIYFKEGKRMYTCRTGNGFYSVLVDSDITKLLTPKDEYADIYYIKNNSLYHKKADKMRELLVKDVYDAICLGENVYFTRKELVLRPYSYFVEDDLKRSDAVMSYPEIRDFYTDGVLNYEKYGQAQQEYQEKTARDDMRSYFEENYIENEEFTLYTIKRDRELKEDEMLTQGYLRYNSSKDIIVYEKNILQEEKIKMSQIESADETALKINEIKNNPMATCMQMLIKGKHPFKALKNFPDGHIEISLDARYIYFIDEIDKNQKGTLYRYDISGRELKSKTKLKEGVTDFALDGSDSSVTVAFCGTKMGICVGEEYTHLSDSSCQRFYYVDGSLFFYDNYDAFSKTGELKIFRDKKIKLVDENVYAFNVRNYKTVSYIKDYNQDAKCGNLYLKEGNKKRKLDSSVKEIIY